jgi:hypothetical protein
MSSINNQNNIYPKSCTYGCNTQIYWNTSVNEYWEVFTKRNIFVLIVLAINHKRLLQQLVILNRHIITNLRNNNSQNQRCPTHLNC